MTRPRRIFQLEDFAGFVYYVDETGVITGANEDAQEFAEAENRAASRNAYVFENFGIGFSSRFPKAFKTVCDLLRATPPFIYDIYGKPTKWKVTPLVENVWTDTTGGRPIVW